MTLARSAASDRTPGVPSAAVDHRYRSLAMLVVLMGVMITAVDTTIVVLGLPVMMQRLHSDMVGMVWVIMAYLLVLTIITTQVGRFGDMYGRVRMYNLGFAIFTAGSLLCGLAASGPQLVVFRVLQGLGGALVSANSGAIIADTVPAAERGRAYGLVAIGWNIGAVLGILLGGMIITFVNWRYIFFINVPIGAVGLVVGLRVLRERAQRSVKHLDVVGTGLLGGGLLLVLLALTDMTGAGFTGTIAVKFVVGVALLVLLVLWERRAAAPLLDLKLLGHPVLRASVLSAFFQSLGGYAVMFLVIMYLQGVRGLSPFVAALVLVPGYVLGGFIAPLAGRIADRTGSRLPVSLGLGLQAVAFLLYASLALGSPVVVVALAALINGVGNAFFFPANNTAVMANAPKEAYGLASGLLRTLSNIGMVMSFAVALLAASTAIPRADAFAIFLGVSHLTPVLAKLFLAGLRTSMLTAIIFLVAALVLSLVWGSRRPVDVAQR